MPRPLPPLLLLCGAVATLTSHTGLSTAARTPPCRAPLECVPLARCPTALRALQEEPKRYPEHCGFNGSAPNVCCPAVTTQSAKKKTSCISSHQAIPEPPPPVVSCSQLAQHYADHEPLDDSGPGKIARRMCRKHEEDLCALPRLSWESACPANGRTADILEFPHMALLGYGERDSIEYSCGGSLVSTDFILTAAHCAHPAGQSVRWALLGATNRTSMTPKENDTYQLIEVSEVIVHPEYGGGRKYNDIALLRLARPALLSEDDVKPACLNTDVDTDFTGQEVVATGWGATDFGGDGSESLIKVNLTLRDLQYCRDTLKLDSQLLPKGLVDTQLCAGGGSHGRDTCQGDSGGPLQVRADPTSFDTCIQRLIGIVSFGPPCGLGQPAVYTRVSAYMEWIESIVWPTRSDGCARIVSPASKAEVSVPNTGPGTVARGMCRVFHVDFCSNYRATITHVKPDLTPDTTCHHNHAEGGWMFTTHPTTVTLRYGTSTYNRQHACAGALVSPRAVLTAARCQALGCLPIAAVVLNDPLSCADVHVFAVDAVRVHPEYRSGEAYADLAVVLLSQSVDLRSFLPLCLDTPAHRPVRPGSRAKASGWNIQGTWEHISSDLANTSLTLRGADECSEALLGNTKVRLAHPKGLLPSQLCAGGLCDDESYGGERGVPLTVRSHTLRSDVHGDYLVDRVLGVASSLAYCSARTASGARLPDLFTSVASHVAWLESVVWSDR